MAPCTIPSGWVNIRPLGPSRIPTSARGSDGQAGARKPCVSMNQFTNVQLKVRVDYGKSLEEALATLKLDAIDSRINSSNFRLQLREDERPEGDVRDVFFKLVEFPGKKALLPSAIEAMVRRKGYATPNVLEVCGLGALLTPAFLSLPVVVPDFSLETNQIPVLTWDVKTHTRHFNLKFWMDIQPDQHQFLVIRR